MNNHAPLDYECPICLLLQGRDNKISKQSDIVYKDEYVMAFICVSKGI
ncbi:hypothetical protein P5G65_22665 [Paenibacillus chondroitinus]|uniref:Uncharacterized protein n=1 Tax=Paenibacillus chondroitinus TaxID=59842 RepID=A0ABU6DIM9_9BACL|nr:MULTISPECIES: hypothetical protein [Paenibacillus]MCY9662659.1 hypothetical protein [Paenibacillus anseongense]MEB4796716.1 hypothetical protein [Paenibacillus chondroitinus]